MSEDRNNSLQDCREVETVTSSPCEENPNAPGCQGPGESPVPAQQQPGNPFLAPTQTIRTAPQDLVSSTREVNVINRNLFKKLSDEFPLEADNIDWLRYYTNKLWSWDGKQEIFLNPTDQLRGQEILALHMHDERFEKTEQGNTFWYTELEFWNGTPESYNRTYAQLNQEYFLTEDTVFAAPQPFFEREVEGMLAPPSTVVTIKPEVGYYEKEENNLETTMPSLYRKYYEMVNPDAPRSGVREDRIQKFTADTVFEMKEANSQIKRSFNSYVEINIATQQGTKVSTLASRFSMDKYFLEMISSSEAEEKDYTEATDETRQSLSQREDVRYSNDRLEEKIPEKTYSSPFSRVISKIPEYGEEFFEGFNNFQYPLKFKNWDNLEGLMVRDHLLSVAFMNKVEGDILTKDNLRSLSDIYAGKKAYSEVMGYKIAKHTVTETLDATGRETYVISEDPIQEFYIMDSDRVLDIEFVDTQVNAGKSYAYRIYSINLVLGSTVVFSNAAFDLNRDERRGPEYRTHCDSHCFPNIKIIEAPFFEKIVSILEKPPLAPQVSFVPVQGKSDEMEILLQSNFGEMFLEPIKIFEREQAIIDKMYESQEPRKDNLLEYQTDSLPEYFEVLRLETPPEKYSDFSRSNYVKKLKTNGRSLLFNDSEFEANKDYYYCFRTYDKIGISNPSLVYKVKLNSYVNGIYLEVKEYEMVPLEQEKFDLSIQRTLKISPSFQQTALRFKEDLDLSSADFAMSAPTRPNFGVGPDPESESENSIWEKTFKLKLTSKQSGRKIDVNFTFNKFIREKEIDQGIQTNELDFEPQEELDLNLDDASRESQNAFEALQQELAARLPLAPVNPDILIREIVDPPRLDVLPSIEINPIFTDPPLRSAPVAPLPAITPTAPGRIQPAGPVPRMSRTSPTTTSLPIGTPRVY